MVCPKCNNEINEGDAFCANCGTVLAVYNSNQARVPADYETKTSPQQEEIQTFEGEPVQQSSFQPEIACVVQAEERNETLCGEDVNRAPKKGKKGIIIAIIALVLVATLAAAYFFLFKKQGADTASSSKAEKPDEQILYVSDDKLYYRDSSFENGICISDEHFNNMTVYYDPSQIYITKDRENIYYRDNFYMDQKTYDLISDLYCRSLTDSEAEPVLIQNNIIDYIMLEDCGYILCQKKDGLYEHNLETGSVDMVSAEFAYIYEVRVCENTANKYYFIEHSYDVPYESGKLYEKTIGEEKVLIDDSVKYCCVLEDSDDIYYEKESDSRIGYDDFVIFDEPENDENRSLIESLEQAEMSAWMNSLYRYNGEESELVAENGFYYCNNEANLQYYMIYDFANMKDQIRLSEITEMYEIDEFIFNKVPKTAFFFIDGAFREVEIKSGVAVWDFISDKNEVILYSYKYISEQSSISEYEIYRITFDGKKFSEPEFLDNEAYSFRYSDGMIVSAKNMNTDTYLCDMYVNGELKIKNVSDFEYIKNGNFFYKIYEEINGNYHNAMYACIGGEEMLVGENIVWSYAFDNGKVIYSTYVEDSAEYEYYLWDNGETEFLGTNDTNCVLSFDTNEQKSNVVYYVVDESLYVYRGESSVKIADGVTTIASGYEGEGY